MKLACLFLAACGALLLPGCQTTPPAGPVNHVAIFWLKDHGNAGDRAKLIGTAETLRKIPGVVSVSAGPCIPSARPIEDSSYDVAVSFTFASKADLDRYLEHPRHKAIVNEVVKPLVKKITVYDF